MAQENKKTRISAIAAITASDRGLGKDNRLLWKIPEDMAHFKKLTMGHPVISGRKNFDSMGRVLPGRANIIVTRDLNYRKENCTVVHSMEDALFKAKALNNEEIFIIGGGEIYKAALPYTDRLYLTIIEGEKEADVFFHDYAEFTKIVSKEKHEHEGIVYSFVTLERP